MPVLPATSSTGFFNNLLSGAVPSRFLRLIRFVWFILILALDF